MLTAIMLVSFKSVASHVGAAILGAAVVFAYKGIFPDGMKKSGTLPPKVK